MTVKGLYIPQEASWAVDLRSELLTFPAGRYDEQVDALEVIVQLLDTITSGSKPRIAEEPSQDTGYRPYAFDQGPLNDWMTW